MPKPNKEIKQLLINDFGYEPVELESYTGQLRALKESFNSLQITNPKDPRLQQLANGIKDLKADREVEKSDGKLRRTRKRRSDAKSLEQINAEIDAKEKKRKAISFVKGAGPEPVDAAPADGGGMSSALMKISNDVNIIKGIVASQNKLDKDKADDTREAREKNKRSMAENLMEGGKGAFKKVAGAFGKVLEPAKGIFESIFNFLKLFVLGAGLMKILDWFGDSGNKSKIESIFKFLKDWWPVLVAGLMALFPGVALIPGIIALTVGFLPKLIDTVKSILGFNKQVDKEIKEQEKDYEKNERGTAFDTKLPEEKEGEVKPEATLTTTGEETAGENLQQPQSFNQGGEVPGQGNTDTVPAMLTPGEFVLTKDAVNQVGADTLYGMNAAAGGVGKPSQQPKPKLAKKKKMKTSTVGTMMNMGGLKMGGMTNNMSYAGGGQVPVQNYFMGGLVKKAGSMLSKTPQARLLRFAANQIKKSPVGTPISKAFKKLKMLGGMPSTPSTDMGDPSLKGETIPNFNVIAPGGRAKEQTLGVRR
jgi:hypothetical protein